MGKNSSFTLDDMHIFNKKKRELERDEKKMLQEREDKGLQGPINPFAGIQIENEPIHLKPPRGSETFDIPENFTLTPPTVSVTLIDWTIPDGVVGFWNGYALYTNTPFGVTAEWNFFVNGHPVFKYHGSSLNNFKKTLALSNDLSNLVYALQELRPKDRIIVTGTISAPAPCSIGARITGWLITERIPLTRVGS